MAGPGLRPVLAILFHLDAAPPVIYPLSLHDALPISSSRPTIQPWGSSIKSSTTTGTKTGSCPRTAPARSTRSEEHTSELQSRLHLVCRLLLEKKHHLREPAVVQGDDRHDGIAVLHLL